jgi:methenyltetrahydromethanopterin cyclohydrolase
MPKLNERAWQLAEAMAADAENLKIAVHKLDCGTRLIDCGVRAAGSIDAGRRLAEVCLSGLGMVEVVQLEKGTGPFLPPDEEFGYGRPKMDLSLFLPTRTTFVRISAREPVAACMASQYAGWEIKGDGYFAMGSGPMRAVAGRELLFDTIGHRETSDRCVGVLETSKLPPESVCLDVAHKCGVAPDRLTLLVARTASPAGTVQIVARSVETALHKLHELGFDLRRIEKGWGLAPLPPVADNDLAAIGLTNDAILYGGYVELSVHGDDRSLEEIGPRVPSSASPDFGRPFAEIFARYDRDFYRIDPLLFSPAVVVFVNVDTGVTHRFGRFAPEVLAESFGGIAR